jgi:hypothetical protein
MVDDQAKAIEIAPCPFCEPQKDEDRQPIFYEARDAAGSSQRPRPTP